jgi:hypothetical protein
MCVRSQRRALQPLLKKFVLHFEASQDLLQQIEAKLDAASVLKYFICMFASYISSNSSHSHVPPPPNAFSRASSPQCSGSEPPVRDLALLTFHSADTDHIFKCVAISNASEADAAITKFISDREFLNILPATSAPVVRGAQQPAFESDLVDTVRVEIPFGRTASTSLYHMAKSNDIRLFNTRKCAENRAAIYVLDSHAARYQLPNWFESGQTLDDIHDKARKFSDEISAIHRERAGLQGTSRCAAAAAAAAAAPPCVLCLS